MVSVQICRRVYQLQEWRKIEQWNMLRIINWFGNHLNLTSALLSQTQALLMISMSGIDETVAQVVHARYSYGVNEILWNHQFVDIMYYNTPDRHRYCDYTHFHDVLPIY
ncbi:MAG: hypothetical protein ACK5RT_15075 [Dolichospermum sp.]